MPRFIMETNTDIPIPQKAGGGVLRCNVYRPLGTEHGEKFPVLMTLGPYGKDVPYENFHPASFAELPKEQKSQFSAWETPEPTYWPRQGYVVIRVDERGTGQSPGLLNTFSAQTMRDFKEAVEWASVQDWSNGKVGLTGISYYAITQWAVAALRPKGLTCIIPWEGMNDLYRDLEKRDGIMGNQFIETWYDRQVASGQYGLPGKAARNWGPDTIEDSLTKEELDKNNVDIRIENLRNKFIDDPYFAPTVYDLTNIEVPLLSVANLGGITLHLRGNVRGYARATSKNKWLYFITGRHDLPYYLPEYVALQKSFLDAWLKGKDDRGWLKGPNASDGVPAVNLLLRKGNPGFNSVDAERRFPRRTETEWPLERTQYTKYYLSANKGLSTTKDIAEKKFTFAGLTGNALQFVTAPFEQETEITGHIVANLVLAIEPDESGKVPKDMDLFVTLRHLDSENKEIFYTGTMGDPAPVSKGWLRASLRAVDPTHPFHKHYQPHHPFTRAVVDYPPPTVPFEALVEIWPTNVVIAAGNKLVFEVSPRDTQGVGIFGLNHPEDRSSEVFGGSNALYVGGSHESWIQFPIIPSQ
ncbi:hypothetical protein M422DRAFT_235107 [Sphaerobolus stellatus SS14]|uniref:Xaa-Pro dipeptidyl-peptidase C-terminal domain-containing protein n=1 Tax=Sphaerobolus stellatus (strain SS14) TaxID=990650 RepID=A0A0C9UM13_SPHS4|nr:hypothetical protein M422DRAFT_235107 [Sphaerobolus stellatus SS14]